MNDNNQIDPIRLLKIVWRSKLTVIKTVVVFILIGLFLSFTISEEYTANSTMMPQSSENGDIGGLGGLAAMAGINLNALGNENVPANLYPTIVKSISFQKDILKEKLYVEGGVDSISLKKYFAEIHRPGLLSLIVKYTVGLPKIIKERIFEKKSEAERKDVMLSITSEEKEIIKDLMNRISVSYDKKNDIIEVKVTMPTARLAAQLTLKVQKLIQEYIIRIKSQKSISQLRFVEERFAEKKKEFLRIQNELALFRDKNKNVTTALAQTKLEMLNSEFNLITGVYTELAKQVETKKIQVREDTPVFSIIDPVSIPSDRSKPRRSIIMILCTLFGAVYGVALIFFRRYMDIFKTKWDSI